ncbi:MAG: CRISPR-associated protein Cas5 [Bacillota bacterium]|nr:CRISPR-associated protein Cas5 [Bacillota bacterium]
MVGVEKVLKVEVSALTTSFRHPFVMIGRLPSFEMPPPSTIYGHLCGVLGEWFQPGDLEFAYTFTHRGLGEDVELAQVLEIPKGLGSKDKNMNNLPKNVGGSLNPQKRQFLLKPNLKLYLRGNHALLETLKKSFLSPHFACLLGRSQDLATCHSTEYVELVESDRAFYSHTLLPWRLRPFVTVGEPVHMPKFIDYQRLREPVFERYLQIADKPLRIFGEDAEEDIIDRSQFNSMLVDKTEQKTFLGKDLYRGVWFHRLKEDE